MRISVCRSSRISISRIHTRDSKNNNKDHRLTMESVIESQTMAEAYSQTLPKEALSISVGAMAKTMDHLEKLTVS